MDPNRTPTHRLAAILSADVHGYSRLMADDEIATVSTLKSHIKAMDELIRLHGGRIVDAPGDNVLAEFSAAIDAVRCAIEIQVSLRQKNQGIEPNRQMEFRVGIQLGDVMVDGETIYGTGINIAARLEALAEPGGICISSSVFEQVHNKLEANFEDIGNRLVKNIPDPVHAYRIRTYGPVPPKVDDRAAITREIKKPWARRYPALIVVTLLVLAIVALRTWKLPISVPRGLPIQKPTRALAVLPFENVSGDPKQEYFADGMTDELITQLARISGLSVISRTSVMQYKGDKKSTLPEIAKVLNANLIVEGSVIRVDNEVRITAQLLDGPSDRHLWANSYESQSQDVLKLQADLASEIVSEIKVEVTPEERAQLADARKVNPQAYEAYLKAQFYWNQLDPESALNAYHFYERATELDPGFAPAYAGLADVYSRSAFFGPPNQVLPLAKAAAQTAVKLDDSLAAAHTSLANNMFQYDFDWAGSEREFQRALVLNPSYAEGHSVFGLALALQGRLDESMAELQHAHRLDPLSATVDTELALALTLKGQYDAAKELVSKSSAKAEDPLVSFIDSFIDIEAGRFNEAIPQLIAARNVRQENFVLGFLGYAYAAAGQPANARKMLDEINQLSTQEYVSPFASAQIYLGLGDRDNALEQLSKAYQAHSPFILTLGVSRMFDPIRDDPRFATLLRKLGLKDRHSAFPPPSGLTGASFDNRKAVVYSHIWTSRKRKTDGGVSWAMIRSQSYIRPRGKGVTLYARTQSGLAGN